MFVIVDGYEEHEMPVPKELTDQNTFLFTVPNNEKEKVSPLSKNEQYSIVAELVVEVRAELTLVLLKKDNLHHCILNDDTLPPLKNDLCAFEFPRRTTLREKFTTSA